MHVHAPQMTAVITLVGVLAAGASFGANDWTRHTPPTVPEGCARAYDPGTNQLVLVPTSSSPAGQVWIRSVETNAPWRRVDPPTPARTFRVASWIRAAIDDPSRKRIVVVRLGVAPGGVDAGLTGPLRAEALELTPSPHWVAIDESSGPFPFDRSDFALVRDSRRDRLVLIGGGSAHGKPLQTDVWTFALGAKGAVWTRLAGADLPEARMAMAAVYDSVDDHVILYGGNKSIGDGGQLDGTSDVLALDLSNPAGWVALSPGGTGPPATFFACAAAVSGRPEVVVTGGYFAKNSVWKLDLSGAPMWQAVHAGPADTDVHDLFETGDAGELLALASPLETWRLNVDRGSEWTLLDAPFRAGPPRRPVLALADPITGTTVVAEELARHRDAEGTHDEVSMDPWQLEATVPARWTKVANPGASPPATVYGTVAYDSRRTRWILMGNGGVLPGSTPSTEIWSLDLAPQPHWVQLTPSGVPPSIYGAAAAYDPLRDRIALFGGGGREGSAAITYLELSGNPRWSVPPQPAHGPRGRNFAALAWDAPRDRFVLFGGQSTWLDTFGETQVRDYADLWSIDAGNAAQCDSLIVTGVGPGRQSSTFAFYEPARDALGMMQAPELGSSVDRVLGDLRELPLAGTSLDWPYRTGPSLTAPPLRSSPFGMFAPTAFDASLDRVTAIGSTKEVWTLDRGSPTHEVLVSLDGPLRPDAHGFVLATILGSAAFDVRDLDASSVTLAGAHAQAASAAGRAGLRDVDGDGDLDRQLRFARADMTLDPAVDVVELRGRTRAGEAVIGWALYQLGEANGRGVSANGAAATGDPDSPKTTHLALAIAGPVRGAARVHLALPAAAGEGAALELFDVAGRRVARHALEALDAGEHALQIDETRGLRAGVYFGRVRAGGETATARFVILD